VHYALDTCYPGFVEYGLIVKECHRVLNKKTKTKNASHLQRKLALSFAMGLLFALTPLHTRAQQITGSIVGIVTDSQGAVIPAATVNATNADTGLSRSTTTGNGGAYRIEYLPIGKYTVAVEAPGFKKFLQQNLVLAVDETQTLNATLAVGASSETVTISAAPPLVDTTTATLGRTVQPAEIIGLPLVNRNAYAELSLTPGVQSNSASGATNASNANPSGTPNYQIGVPSTQVVVNGGIDGGVPMVSFFLDGGSNMTGIRNYGNPLPNPDALEEFRVETSNFSAQYGRMSGAVVTAVTRSGTNQFHGSLFEFVRNTSLNATPWNATLNPPYHRNQFGGAIGGPVKHDHAFFFFSYAGLRQTVGQFLSGGVVPTSLERQGDFSQSKVIPDLPGTKTTVRGTNSSPNCQLPTVGCVPSALIDPTAANIISKYIPVPNSANNAWTGFFTGPTNQDEYLGKYDQVLGDKDHLTGSYFYLNSTQNAYGSGNLLWDINQSFSKQQNVNLSDTHIFNATTVNQAWIGFTRVAGGRVNLPQVSLGDLGSNFTTQGPKALPSLTISGYFTVGGALAGPVTTTDFYSIRDLVSITKGKHSINFGGELALDKNMLVGNLDNYGVFNFQNSAPTTTGNALGDFVTGQVNTMEQDVPYHGLMSDWHTAFFVQDTYRISPRLTANLGLRWDIDLPPVESSNLTSTFVPNVQSTVVPSAPLGLLYPGDKGVPRGIVDLRWHHISPRIGLAVDPFGDGKTALRAAAGVFYGSVSGNEWNQPANAQPFAIRQTFNSITSLTNVYGNPASFPTGDPFPYIYSPSAPRFLPAASVETIAQNVQWPLVYQINASAQRQLPLNISLLTAYVGTLSHDLPIMIDDNYAPYAPGASTSQTSINARRPYDPGVLGQNVFLISNQTASYHSLQISGQRRMTSNLTLNGFYVLSHSFQSSNESAVGQATAQDFAHLEEERGPTDNDRRHMAGLSGIWNLEYYKGSNFVVRQLANHWTISTIATLYSGAPVNITTGSNRNFDSANANRPNLVPGVNAFLDPHRARAVAAAAWFDTAAFTPNGPGLGTGPFGADGNTGRDYLRAPGYRDVDLGIFRNFSIERFTLQIRGEATNAFNMVSLNAPTANLASTLNGKITSAASPRLIQVGARLTF
jgi:Carboxypeptidase regulatory-like domain